MEAFVPKTRNIERKIQNEIICMLRNKGWFVKETHGNMYQCGFPDLFATHHRYGSRWIEVKNPIKYAFTPAQLEEFPKFCVNGSHIWILTGANDVEYNKLFKQSNWHLYLL